VVMVMVAKGDTRSVRRPISLRNFRSIFDVISDDLLGSFLIYKWRIGRRSAKVAKS